MTAEIAIVNRTAIVLAADSAVTLNVRGAEKIYTSAEKLFEFSLTDPMGIMIYNNLEFMGVPLDVIIKTFRDQRTSGQSFTKLEDAAKSFFDYLENTVRATKELEERRGFEIISPLLRKIRLEFNAAAASALERETRRKRVDYPTLLNETIQTHVARLESAPDSDCFPRKSYSWIAKAYQETIDGILKELFNEEHTTEENRKLLRRAALLSLVKDVYSETLTGIVIAGFGRNPFPSLMAYEVDGIIGGKLKKKEVQRVNTGRAAITAEIIPFAQREMVDRFLYGVDPEFEDGIEEFLRTIVQTTGEILIGRMPRASRKTKKDMEGSLNVAVEVGLRHWRERMVPAVKRKFQQQIEDMLLLMPKQEMANLAEAMINLTSVKRKFSAEKETVAGPIDVAVISRSDGFIWVKRKHYFDPELNPRYFVRKFGEPSVSKLTGGRNGRGTRI